MEPMDFQAATAKRIFQIYHDEGQNRVLLADEVGLGKTIIASAVVRLISQWHREEQDDHFKVVYICSNINIANQNCRKLGIPEKDCLDFSESRLSMQHLRIYETDGKDHSYEQLIPMTPATSFSMKGGQGTQAERALIYEILRHHPVLAPMKSKLRQLMKFEKELKAWDWYLNEYKSRVRECDKSNGHYLSDMILALDNAFSQAPELLQGIRDVCSAPRVMNVPYAKRREVVNAVRQVFARISLERLEPNFVIMDEFQRFRDLISCGDSEQKMLTTKFLADSDVKVLLLSATPYKPYSTLEELSEGGENHYQEFTEVMDFLFKDEAKRDSFHEIWRDYSNHLAEIKTDDFTALIARKNAAQDALYQCVCRTERLSDSIIDRSKATEMSPLLPADITSYTEMQGLMDSLDLGKFPVDYVKSAPYLLSFMNYRVKEKIVQELEKTGDYRLVERSDTMLLRKNRINRYEEIPCNNSRLQTLFSDAFGGAHNGAELLLWVPASRPYYKTNTVFSRNAGYSKTLVFSSWEMVPRMIAGLTSYEAERLTLSHMRKKEDGKDKRYFAQDNFDQKRKRRAVTYRLRDDMARVLTYPCVKLAEAYKPLSVGAKTLTEVKAAVRTKIKALLGELSALPPVRRSAGQMVSLMQRLDGVPTVEELRGIPAGAEDLLVNLAIGSPAICAYRLFAGQSDAIKNAETVADKFVALFNKQESTTIIDVLYGNKQDDDAYYENVASYCVDGNLQAVLDEYAFTLGGQDPALAKHITDGFTDTASIQIDSRESFLQGRDKPRLRTHFAIGYFNAQVSEKTVQRTENIRTAFNSPFRPFVLATTSIGQEGLDFHQYCRKIMHWNLPANPIDLEQREGRINRYLCHAIRQNLAESKFGDFPFDQSVWQEILGRASEGLKGEQSDLIPYWYLPNDFPYTRKIERIVPMYPFSQDRCRYDRLLEVLSIYRLTLGQPKQEELYEAIHKEHWDEASLEELYINLSPWIKEKENTPLFHS